MWDNKSERYAGYLKMAGELASSGVLSNHGGPFGAVIVSKEGEVVGRGYNRVTSSLDPTAHAEIVAIRDACTTVKNFKLEGATIYSSSEPCPMCMAAIYWARISKVVYSNSKSEAAKIGFDDLWLDKELHLPLDQRKVKMIHIESPSCKNVFGDWANKNDKVMY